MISQAIQSVLMLLCLIGVGFFLAPKPWFGQNGSKLFSKFAVQVAIPCYMFYNVWDTCGSVEKLKNMFLQVPVPFLIISMGLIVGIITSKLLKISIGRRGVFINAVSFSNTVIIGFPIIEALFGNSALPQAMVYYMANTVLFWTVGVFLLRRDAAPDCKLLSLQNLKSIFSPALIGFFLGAITVCLSVPIPAFLMDAITMIKQLTTPIAMIFIGSVLRNNPIDLKIAGKELGVIVFFRFVVTPVLAIFLCNALYVSSDTSRIFLILATMPAMTQLGIMAHESKSDGAFAALTVTVTTMISMVTIPIYVLLMEYVFYT